MFLLEPIKGPLIIIKGPGKTQEYNTEEIRKNLGDEIDEFIRLINHEIDRMKGVTYEEFNIITTCIYWIVDEERHKYEIDRITEEGAIVKHLVEADIIKLEDIPKIFKDRG